MNIEEAVEIQKNIRQKILDGKRIREGAYLYWQIEQSIETVLNELDKKDKVINYMGDWLDNELGKGAKEDFIKRAGVN